MLRIFISIFLFLLLSIVQISFFAALPVWLAATPFVFALGVYLLQHQGLSDGAWWLIGFGGLLDFLHLGHTPLEVVAFAGATGVAVWTSRRLFSNRSFYGILGCIMASFVALVALESIIALLIHANQPSAFAWHAFGRDLVARTGTLVVTVAVLFPFAKRIRGILHTLLLLPAKQKTYS